MDYITEPKIPETPQWSYIDKLNHEKEITGIYVSGHPLDTHQLELNHFTDCDIRSLNDKAQDGRTVRIAGIVSTVRHGTNQKGNGYCRFTLQDYTDSYDFGIYQESYQNFGNLIQEGQVIYIEARFSKRYNSDEVYLRPTDIKLLSTIGQTLTKSITLRVSTDMITAEFIGKMNKLCSAQTGKHEFKLQVVGQEESLSMNLKSKGMKVDVNQAFVHELSRMGVSYKLN
jgi:DNA polymerase-3 subunit alpha